MSLRFVLRYLGKVDFTREFGFIGQHRDDPQISDEGFGSSRRIQSFGVIDTTLAGGGVSGGQPPRPDHGQQYVGRTHVAQ